MHINERLDDHQKFRELAVLAQRRAISDTEQLQLNNHLRVCRACRNVCDEYLLISALGMPFLAATFDHDREAEEWDSRPARGRLMAQLRGLDDWDSPGKRAEPGDEHSFFSLRNAAFPWGVAVLAACILVAIAATMYWWGVRTRVTAQQNLPMTTSGMREIAAAKDGKEELVAVQNAQLLHVRSELAKTRQEVLRLQQTLQAAENYSAVIAKDHAKTAEQLRAASAERDKLTDQLRDAEQSFQLLKTELTNVRADHEKTLLRTTSLQKRVDELEDSVRDQERKLNDDQLFLASDRDIRELMGARKLYIADVFDVDSGSRTRKPFGRVFYTQSKSLVFYAFDLDRQPGIKTASAFQVWGQRDAEEQNHATNLGILYMDSESNRRWVLKINDPKQLAEIDAVFVTIEPRGGSQKPTGKPFLYALLRKEANHP
jgi:hypothetical protein